MDNREIQKAYDGIFPSYEQRERMLAKIRSQEEKTMKPFEFTSKPEPNHARRWVPAAAAVVLICCAGAFIAFRPSAGTVDPVETRWETVPPETAADLQTEANVTENAPAAPRETSSGWQHVCTTDPCDDDYHRNDHRDGHHEDRHH